jgi:hypothetical protein
MSGQSRDVDRDEEREDAMQPVYPAARRMSLIHGRAGVPTAHAQMVERQA